MGKNEEDALLRDAIYQHLIREGYTAYMAEVESGRRMMRKNEL